MRESSLKTLKLAVMGLLLGLIASGFAQTTSSVFVEKWRRSFAAETGSTKARIQVDVDRFGNIYYATNERISDTDRAFLGLVTKEGNRLWHKPAVPNATKSFVYDIKVDWNGFVYVLARATVNGNTATYLLRYSKEGNLEWWRTVSDGDRPLSLGLDRDGNVYFFVAGKDKAHWFKFRHWGEAAGVVKIDNIQTAFASNFLAGGESVLVGGNKIIKVRGNGSIMWKVERGDIKHFSDVWVLPNGNVLVALLYQDGDSLRNVLVLLSSANGAVVWDRIVPVGTHIAVSPSGNIFVGGLVDDAKLRIRRFDANGTLRNTWNIADRGVLLDLVADRYNRVYALVSGLDGTLWLYTFDAETGQALGRHQLDKPVWQAEMRFFGDCDLIIGAIFDNKVKKFYWLNVVPQTKPDTYTVASGANLSVNSPGVLSNDRWAETAVLVNTTTNGTLTLNATGGFNYKPNAGFVGTDTFTYRAKCGAATSAVTTVTITVTGTQNPGNQTVTAVRLDPTTVTGGTETSRGVVFLSGPAPAGGQIVNLRTDTVVAQVPNYVTVLEGHQSAVFTVNTKAVERTVVAEVAASTGNVTKTATLTVNPGLYVTDLAISQSTINGGSTATATVTLGQPAPAGGAAVRLWSSSSAIVLPEQVIVPAGSRTATFTVTTKPVTQTYERFISASFGGVTKYLKITLTP